MGFNTTRRVSYRGGLIGLFSGESQGKALERELVQLNADGYRVVFIINDRWNFFARLFWALIFILTVFLYSKQPNLLIIGERSDAAGRANTFSAAEAAYVIR